LHRVVIEAQSAGRAVLKQLEAAVRPAKTGMAAGTIKLNWPSGIK
jgi:hypothetical protein